jgi:hypothetical protein
VTEWPCIAREKRPISARSSAASFSRSATRRSRSSTARTENQSILSINNPRKSLVVHCLSVFQFLSGTLCGVQRLFMSGRNFTRM